MKYTHMPESLCTYSLRLIHISSASEYKVAKAEEVGSFMTAWKYHCTLALSSVDTGLLYVQAAIQHATV